MTAGPMLNFVYQHLVLVDLCSTIILLFLCLYIFLIFSHISHQFFFLFPVPPLGNLPLSAAPHSITITKNPLLAVVRRENNGGEQGYTAGSHSYQQGHIIDSQSNIVDIVLVRLEHFLTMYVRTNSQSSSQK